MIMNSVKMCGGINGDCPFNIQQTKFRFCHMLTVERFHIKMNDGNKTYTVLHWNIKAILMHLIHSSGHLLQFYRLYVAGDLKNSVCTKGFEVQCPKRVFGSFRCIQLETDEECRVQTQSIKMRQPVNQYFVSNRF